ncbi:hypothetical protein BJ165DRAFT_1595679 [Panaeolus papilionaceus]|nr:hypothetical protein BJ165DRAFT_1595679 [Panaeolus papilionaceus]
MQLKFYPLVFFALELALLATTGMAYYDDNYELASRELRLDGFANHYLREFSDSDLSHIATRDLVVELEERLVRRGGKHNKGTNWATLSVPKLKEKLMKVEGLLQTAAPEMKAKFQRQIEALKKLILKKEGPTGGGAGGGATAAKTGADPNDVTDPNGASANPPANSDM